MVKNPPNNAQDVRDMGSVPGEGGGEDILEEGMATHSNILAWRIHERKLAGNDPQDHITKSHRWLKQLSMQAKK